MLARLLISLCLLAIGNPNSVGTAVSNLPSYETKYYILYTDLDRDAVQEATVHITKMAEVYANRTREFSGVIRTKLPFMLYRSEDDYLSAGGAPGSAGVFTGRALMAVAGEKLSARTWHVVQHEGFHQFAQAVIGGDMPTWVNEGLAEYFGEGLFTGDDIITGIIPEWRRKRIVNSMQAKRFKSIDQIMRLSLGQWNEELSVVNYDQAWSMVQFLAHGEGGKYQPNFNKFMRAVSRRIQPTQAWRDAFGDGSGFEDRWKEYWLKLPENPTDDLYRRATVQTLASYLGRAFAAGQDFDSMPEFSKAASENALQCAAEDALPKSLLAGAMNDVGNRLKAGEEFVIEHGKGRHPQPRVVVRSNSSTSLIGDFVLRNGHVGEVTLTDARTR